MQAVLELSYIVRVLCTDLRTSPYGTFFEMMTINLYVDTPIPGPLPERITWEVLAEHTFTLADLTPYQREAAARAFIDLGEVLRDDVWGLPHPIRHYAFNFAPWTRLALTGLAADLRSLEDSPGFETLVARLRAPERWGEGYSVSSIAARLVARDFSVEFDPDVMVHGGPKQPDLLVKNEEVGDSIYVEVSALQASRAEEEAHRAFRALSEACWMETGIDFAGRMHRTPSKHLLDQMMRRTRQAIGRAQKTGKMQIVDMPHELELAVAPRSDVEFLQTWAQERGIQGFSGPATSPDTINRIKGKIRNEQKQLPKDSLGAIVLDVPFGFFLWEARDEMAEIHLRDLGETIAEYPNLLSVVLRCQGMSFSHSKAYLHVEGQTYAKGPTRPPYDEELFLLTNRSCKLKLTPATMTAWTRAFVP